MANAEVIDVIGTLGGCIIAISAPMQLYKSWESQSTKDISWLWISFYFCGITFLYAYAWMASLPPIWGPGRYRCRCTCVHIYGCACVGYDFQFYFLLQTFSLFSMKVFLSWCIDFRYYIRNVYVRVVITPPLYHTTHTSTYLSILSRTVTLEITASALLFFLKIKLDLLDNKEYTLDVGTQTDDQAAISHVANFGITMGEDSTKFADVYPFSVQSLQHVNRVSADERNGAEMKRKGNIVFNTDVKSYQICDGVHWHDMKDKIVGSDMQ